MNNLEQLCVLVNIREYIFGRIDTLREAIIEDDIVTWQEMAQVDRIGALKMLRSKHPEKSLFDLTQVLDNYLINC
jgi:hypothetical protein